MSEDGSGRNAHQDARAAAAAQMAAAMQAMGPAGVERLKKAFRRRAMLFGLGFAVVLVGLFLPASLGLPVFVPSLVMIGGGALAFMGLLGPQRGSGCMAYITGFTWLLAIGCGVVTEVVAVQYALAGSAFAFALLSLLLPKPREQGPLSMMASMANAVNMANNMQQQGGATGSMLGSRPRAKDRVIDVDAEET
ncbi:MAG: hypothetical protein H6713_26585 [Myxococcales bacterium]|nr:hypothetical protein [Myxococcales bacterium]